MKVGQQHFICHAQYESSDRHPGDLRPPKLNAHQRREAIERLRKSEAQADIARTYGLDATTIGRLGAHRGPSAPAQKNGV